MSICPWESILNEHHRSIKMKDPLAYNFEMLNRICFSCNTWITPFHQLFYKKLYMLKQIPLQETLHVVNMTYLFFHPLKLFVL